MLPEVVFSRKCVKSEIRKLQLEEGRDIPPHAGISEMPISACVFLKPNSLKSSLGDKQKPSKYQYSTAGNHVTSGV